jgi:hypothetical protein
VAWAHDCNRIFQDRFIPREESIVFVNIVRKVGREFLEIH